MKTHLPCLTIVFLLVAPGAASAGAQELAGTFDQLRVLVKPGDRITVADDAGREMAGTIADLSSTSLGLLVDGQRHDLHAASVDTIRQRRSDSLANGAKWGFAIGAGLGLAGGLAIASEVDDGSAAFVALLTLVYGGMGAAVGVGFDAMVSSDQVIYARRAAAARFSVKPLLARRRQGALVTIGF